MGQRRAFIPPSAHAAIAARVRAGETLASVAVDYVTSRQRIHQIAQAVDPGAAAAGREVRRQEAAAERAAARAARIAAKGTCVVCWRPITSLRSGGRTCGGRCAELWHVVRLVLDEEVHATHRRARARNVLAAPAEPYPGAWAWARGVLAGRRPPNRRYVHPDGAVVAALAEVARLRREVARSQEAS